MAKRKAARSTGRKSTAKRAGASRSRSTARKGARKAAARKTTRKAAGKAAARKAGSKKAARKTSARKAAPVRRTAKPAPKKAAAKAKAPARKAAPKRPTTSKRAAAAPVRKAPALDRPRRTIAEDDLVPTPPSSLDLDRSASAVRSGRRGMKERFAEHTETSPALTAGDVDADWESAYSVGDEAPGGDNPTPDQDIVDDIGHAIGVEYEDNEELKGDEKIAKRDRKRWELDPASSEDYPDRD